MEKVSIILPVYNGEKYLTHSISSVLRQTYSNLELIIVNDCSNDNSESIIAEYLSRHDQIVYLKNETNMKLPASLNRGFSVATGKYFTWTSDDNMYHPDAIEKMVAYLEQHPDIGMVACDMNRVNEDGFFQGIVRVGEANELIIGNNVGACFLYRACVAKAVGCYRTDLFLIEDYDYWLRIQKQFQIGFLHETLYDYREHKESLSSSKKDEIRKVLWNYQWKNLRTYEKSHLPKEQLFRFFNSILLLKPNKVHRILLRLSFGLRHPEYFRFYLKGM